MFLLLCSLLCFLFNQYNSRKEKAQGIGSKKLYLTRLGSFSPTESLIPTRTAQSEESPTIDIRFALPRCHQFSTERKFTKREVQKSHVLQNHCCAMTSQTMETKIFGTIEANEDHFCGFTRFLHLDDVRCEYESCYDGFVRVQDVVPES